MLAREGNATNKTQIKCLCDVNQLSQAVGPTRKTNHYNRNQNFGAVLKSAYDGNAIERLRNQQLGAIPHQVVLRFLRKFACKTGGTTAERYNNGQIFEKNIMK